MAVASPEPIQTAVAGPSAGGASGSSASRTAVSPGVKDFDVVEAYRRALFDDNNPHPIAAILALVEQMEASTAETTTGLARELKAARLRLTSTQTSLGVRAGCQLWENFFADSQYGTFEFGEYKRNLIEQGRAFCNVTAAQCRDKIANLAVDFLQGDCTILTHSYSRTVMKTLLRASAQRKRIKVYVTEAKPNGLGLRTHELLTAAGIPCTLVLDSAVAYVMERVDMVLVGSEAVMESGGLVSAVGTYQMALLAKAHQKPFYALAESYKFLRHFPLSQTDLPNPKSARLNGQPVIPLSFDTTLRPTPSSISTASASASGGGGGGSGTANRSEQPSTSATITTTTTITTKSSSQVKSNSDAKSNQGRNQNQNAPPERPDTPPSHSSTTERNVTRAMLELNPGVDVTMPNLIDYIITDLGSPLSPTSVSQYIVAQFAR